MEQTAREELTTTPVDSLIYWIWLAERLGVGSRKCMALLDAFGSVRRLYDATADELRAAPVPFEMDERRVARLMDKNLTREASILEACERSGYTVLPLTDCRYPMSLRDLSDPPTVLYCVGKMPDFNHRLCIGVVGTRQMSEYGKQIAYKISYELANAGAVVVSGMALGIDGVASAAALAARGSTVAVLGCGLDITYPAEHGRLYEVLREQGFVVSEYPPGTPPVGRHFPERNRIISGLSAGVLVVEASAKSGSIITANLANEEGRDVFAVPGNIGFSGSDGTNALLQNGARIARSAEDILSHYRDLYRATLLGADETDLGEKSCCNPRVLVRLDVYSRTETGYSRIPAAVPRQEEYHTEPPVSSGTKDAKAAPRKAPTTGKSGKPEKPEKPGKSEKPKAEKYTQTEKNEPLVRTGDTAAQSVRLSHLSEEGRQVFAAIPLDRPVTMDELTELGLSTSSLLVALSLLEINGLIHTLPGGKYARS